MAHIGMKYPVAAPWTEGETYTKGFVVGKAIKFTGTPNKNDVDLYADDGIAETDKSVKDMGVSLNVDDLALKVQADLLGHTYTISIHAPARGATALDGFVFPSAHISIHAPARGATDGSRI